MGVRLEITDLSRSFRKGGQTIEVLRGASLQAEPGDALALVGQSGSGKSTFLQIVGGLEPPTSGQVRVDGRPGRSAERPVR
ncbi:MAG TPA: ATP-binding cassette domain-containing protein, partial [Myxococcota bacterium]|nr:ATP-binding cassette domain-containing protein [Myxococcota bacterium]